MKILVGCEESQAITKEFRLLGHEAYSCDLLPCSGGHPEWHLQMDVFQAIDILKPDMGIFHPPCTFVAGSSVQWLSHPDDKHLPFYERRPHPKYPNRRKEMECSVHFVKRLYAANIPKIAIENPIGLLSTMWMKPSQIVQPYMFGDEATKSTCLWLKGLSLLIPTNIVGKGERAVFKSGKSHPKWYADALKSAKTKQERQTLRSKTFPGMAKAMAGQWASEYITNSNQPVGGGEEMKPEQQIKRVDLYNKKTGRVVRMGERAATMLAEKYPNEFSIMYYDNPDKAINDILEPPTKQQ